MTFLAYRVEQTKNEMQGSWQTLTETDLAPNHVEINVQYSSINYKDALSATGNKAVSKHYPHTPGIDAAGVVAKSNSENVKTGDEVLVFGYDLGMNTAGGFAQKIHVPAAWVIKKPARISFAQTMSWGTAGFTAALSVKKLIRAGILPDNGPVVVTGATGGVGSVAVALLSKLGFEVYAVTGKTTQSDFLHRLGAAKVLSREEILIGKGKAMTKALYQAALDTAGAEMVNALLPQIKAEGAVSTCAMIAGTQIDASIFPFILRGVSLLGVDSVEIPLSSKQALVDKVANDWALPQLEQLTTEIGRSQLQQTLTRLLQGEAIGRYRLNLGKA